MRPQDVRSIDHSIDLNMCICSIIRPVRVISVQLLWLLFNDAYLF